MAVNVTVLLPYSLTVTGLNEAVTPLGRPDMDKVTLPLNPSCGLSKTYAVLLVPCVTVKLPPEPNVNPNAPTVKVIVVAALSVPDVPVRVKGNVPMAAVPLATSVSKLVPV